MSTETDTATVSLVGLVPLVRPDWQTVSGLRTWAGARGTLAKQALLPYDVYLTMTTTERRRYDRRRETANANIDIIETPMSVAVAAALEDGIWVNAQNTQPGAKPGFMINGGGAQGKTATVLAVVADFMEEWLDEHALPLNSGGRRNAHEPVVYVRTPDKPTPKGICQAILRAVGEPFLKTDHFDWLQAAVHDVLVSLGVRVLVLDDITRIKLHRLDDQVVLDLIRSLMDSGATVVLVGVGIPASGLLREGAPDTDARDDPQPAHQGPVRLRKLAVEDDDERTQTERRFTLLHVRNFSNDTPERRQEWTTFLVGVAHQLRLYGVDHTSLVQDDLPEYLFRRTGGVVGSLVQLVTKAARQAMRERDTATGHELITRAILDATEIDFAGEDGRIREAHEEPEIPLHRTRASTSPGRPRTTVLDDKHGRRSVGK